MGAVLPRLDSGIPGLDSILGGGLVEGSSYILQGQPGTGKTIMANQIAFRQAKLNRPVLYVTLLAESHQRLFQSLSTLDFYDPADLGIGISYLSVFQTLITEGLHAVVEMLRKEISRQGAQLLIIDGLLTAHDKADTVLDIKTFIAELQGHAAFTGCTALFLTSARVGQDSPEHTMADGVIELQEEVFGVRTVRRLQVRKSRGSAALGGFHQYVITQKGIEAFPRLEVFLAEPSSDKAPQPVRIASGTSDLDAIIGGGLPDSSVTVVIGPSGSGKTTLTLGFLDEATPDQPGLYFGFYEPPSRLVQKAAFIGHDFAAAQKAGSLSIIWQPIRENLLDELGHRLLDAVKRHGIKRLVLDGLGGFERAAVHPGRQIEYFSVLLNELRAQGVTTLATWETQNIFGTRLTAPGPEFSTIVDNVILLRQAEIASELKRILAVLKMRDSSYDGGLHEVVISGQGLTLVGKIRNVEGAVTGLAHLIPDQK